VYINKYTSILSKVNTKIYNYASFYVKIMLSYAKI